MLERPRDLRPPRRTRARLFDLVFDEGAVDAPAPFTLEWLFDHVEAGEAAQCRTRREGTPC